MKYLPHGYVCGNCQEAIKDRRAPKGVRTATIQRPEADAVQDEAAERGGTATIQRGAQAMQRRLKH